MFNIKIWLIQITLIGESAKMLGETTKHQAGLQK